jgi:hypothetical protein
MPDMQSWSFKNVKKFLGEDPHTTLFFGNLV